MQEKSKRIRIVAGPNGSGKTTVLRKIQLNYFSGPYLNADEILLALSKNRIFNPVLNLNIRFTDKQFQAFYKKQGASWIEKSKKNNTSISLYSKNGIFFTKLDPNSYDAAMAADFLREMFLKKDATFTFETVFSHPSKLSVLERAKKKGFKNYLYFICTVDPVINVERVKQRHQLGGHNVPKDKIVKRYFDSLSLLKDVIPLCYRCFFFDNSADDSTSAIHPIAEIDNKGNLIFLQEKVPNWLDEYVIQPLYN